MVKCVYVCHGVKEVHVEWAQSIWSSVRWCSALSVLRSDMCCVTCVVNKHQLLWSVPLAGSVCLSSRRSGSHFRERGWAEKWQVSAKAWRDFLFITTQVSFLCFGYNSVLDEDMESETFVLVICHHYVHATERNIFVFLFWRIFPRILKKSVSHVDETKLIDCRRKKDFLNSISS